MKITLTISGPTTYTLADISATPRVTALIESWSGQSIVQIEPLFRATNDVKFASGNAGGQIVFTAGCSYADVPTAVTAFVTAYGLLNSQGALKILNGATTLATMQNAILRDVARVEFNGKWLKLRYTFEFTTCV